MARPDFEIPDFLDNSDANEIQERMMENLPSDISDMEGDFPYDFTMPTAIELSQLIQFNLVRTLMIAFPEYAWDEWLDLHGEQAGVIRNAASYATGYVEITAALGTFISSGAIVAVPATNVSEAIEFELTESVYFAESITQTAPIRAVVAGPTGNVSAGTITILGIPVSGVTSITNPDATSGGADEEDDDDYYERIHAEFADATSYVGNDADYIKWAKQISGIGDCIVDTSITEPGVVRLSLVDSNGRPASEALVQEVYDHIVSPDDRSKRLLPTACSRLVVVSATTLVVNYQLIGLTWSGTELEDALNEFKEKVLDVYAAAKEDNLLKYNTIRNILFNINGIEDFDDFLINGGRTNIVLAADEYPDTGTITVSMQEEEGETVGPA